MAESSGTVQIQYGRQRGNQGIDDISTLKWIDQFYFEFKQDLKAPHLSEEFASELLAKQSGQLVVNGCRVYMVVS